MKIITTLTGALKLKGAHSFILGGVSHVALRRLGSQAALWPLSRRASAPKIDGELARNCHARFRVECLKPDSATLPLLRRSLSGAATAMQTQTGPHPTMKLNRKDFAPSAPGPP